MLTGQTRSFLRALRAVLKFEGGFVEHPEDLGGPTNWGISSKLLLSLSHASSVYDLRFGEAIEIYFEQFWAHYEISCSRIALINEIVAGIVFDAAVLHGRRVAAMMFQRSINLSMAMLGLQTTPFLVVDGIVGERTLEAYEKVSHKMGGFEFTVLFSAFRLQHVYDLIEANERLKVFVGGWIKRIEQAYEYYSEEI
jgi:lysozyme family protein